MRNEQLAISERVLVNAVDTYCDSEDGRLSDIEKVESCQVLAMSHLWVSKRLSHAEITINSLLLCETKTAIWPKAPS